MDVASKDLHPLVMLPGEPENPEKVISHHRTSPNRFQSASSLYKSEYIYIEHDLHLIAF